MSGIGFRKGKDDPMGEMPMVSVITPSFRCAAFIRECIESVLAQNYPNFEHIIIDGASQDGTVEILNEYSHLQWISEPDTGEAEALNKALSMVRGDIIGWLNADDYYLEGVFNRVAREIDPHQGRHVVYGNANMIDEKGQLLWEKRSASAITLSLLLRWWEHPRLPHQPSIFYSKALVTDIGPFNPDLHFSIDYEYWLRIIVKYRFHYIDQTFTDARVRADSKSLSTVPAQIQSHWRVSLPYHRYLNVRERVKFWRDYCVDYKSPIIPKTRGQLRLRTRLKGLVGMMLKMVVNRVIE